MNMNTATGCFYGLGALGSQPVTGAPKWERGTLWILLTESDRSDVRTRKGGPHCVQHGWTSSGGSVSYTRRHSGSRNHNATSLNNRQDALLGGSPIMQWVGHRTSVEMGLRLFRTPKGWERPLGTLPGLPGKRIRHVQGVAGAPSAHQRVCSHHWGRGTTKRGTGTRANEGAGVDGVRADSCWNPVSGGGPPHPPDPLRCVQAHGRNACPCCALGGQQEPVPLPATVCHPHVPWPKQRHGSPGKGGRITPSRVRIAR